MTVFVLEINENLLKTKNMYEASQKFEHTLNYCNLWLERIEKELLPEKYKLEPLELIVAEKNVENILVWFCLIIRILHYILSFYA